MVFRPLPILSIFTVLSFATLILLGNWQWSRYRTKTGQIEAPEVTASLIKAAPISNESETAQLVYGLVDGLSVWRRYVPAKIEGEGGFFLLLYDVVVSIDPVPLSLAGLEPVTRESTRFVPTASRGRFSTPDRPSENIWYYRDVPAMLFNLGFDAPGDVEVVEPVDLLIDHPQLGPRWVANPYAAPTPIDPLPPARHLGYALTWWGLAGGLISVYLAFHAANGRLRFRRG